MIFVGPIYSLIRETSPANRVSQSLGNLEVLLKPRFYKCFEEHEVAVYRPIHSETQNVNAILRSPWRLDSTHSVERLSNIALI